MKNLKTYNKFNETLTDKKNIYNNIKKYIENNDINKFKQNINFFQHYEMDSYEWNLVDILIRDIIFYDRLEMMKILLDYDKRFIEYLSEASEAIIFVILQSGTSDKILKYFLENNLFDINIQNSDGDTPLIYCVYRMYNNDKYQTKFFNYIKMFIEKGADWNIKNFDEKVTFIEKLENEQHKYFKKIINLYPEKYNLYKAKIEAKKFKI